MSVQEGRPGHPEFSGHLGEPEAERLDEALEQRDRETSRAIIAAAAAPEERCYCVGIAAGTQDVEERIDGPVRDETDPTIPLLIRSARLIYWSWEARSDGFTNTVSEEASKVWCNRLRKAELPHPGSAEVMSDFTRTRAAACPGTHITVRRISNTQEQEQPRSAGVPVGERWRRCR